MSKGKQHYKEVVVNDKVTFNGKKYYKGQTVRESVPLRAIHAKTLNESSQITGCKYELIGKEQPKVKSDERIELEAQANELGVSFRENIGDAKLKLKIEQAKDEMVNIIKDAE